jgi:hypothetical protein
MDIFKITQDLARDWEFRKMRIKLHQREEERRNEVFSAVAHTSRLFETLHNWTATEGMTCNDAGNWLLTNIGCPVKNETRYERAVLGYTYSLQYWLCFQPIRFEKTRFNSSYESESEIVVTYVKMSSSLAVKRPGRRRRGSETVNSPFTFPKR